jgi:hypothetical protein
MIVSRIRTNIKPVINKLVMLPYTLHIQLDSKELEAFNYLVSPTGICKSICNF